MEISIVQNRIREIRGQKVLLDRELAEMYGVPTKVLNQAVKRNIERFDGEDFMFQLTEKEAFDLSRSQFVTLNNDLSRSQIVILNNDFSRSQIATLNEANENLKSQNVTSSKGRGSNIKYAPFAFTELGVAMLSSVLNSKTAIDINRNIMRAFVLMRQYAMSHRDLTEKLAQIEEKYDRKFIDIEQALTYLIDKDKVIVEQANRERIGYKIPEK